jgi:hypothetical protein
MKIYLNCAGKAKLQRALKHPALEQSYSLVRGENESRKDAKAAKHLTACLFAPLRLCANFKA